MQNHNSNVFSQAFFWVFTATNILGKCFSLCPAVSCSLSLHDIHVYCMALCLIIFEQSAKAKPSFSLFTAPKIEENFILYLCRNLLEGLNKPWHNYGGKILTSLTTIDPQSWSFYCHLICTKITSGDMSQCGLSFSISFRWIQWIWRIMFNFKHVCFETRPDVSW